MKKIIALIMVAVMAFSLVACAAGQQEQGEPTESTKPAGETIITEASNGVNASDLTIAGVIHVESYVGTMMKKGMEDASAKYGVNLLTTNYNGDAAKHVEAVNTYIAQHVDGLVAAVSETSFGIYEAAGNQGIPVSVFNSEIDGADWMCSQVGYTQAGLGEGAADYAVEFITNELGGSANVHVVRVLKGSYGDARGDAFMATLQAAFGDKAKMVSESSTYVVAEAIQQVTDALTANPDINIVYCEGEDALMGAYTAIQNTGNTGKVFAFGVDGNTQLSEYLLDENDPILQATCAQEPYKMAYTATENLILTLLGERESDGGVMTALEPIKLNKGDLPAVQTYYNELKAADNG